MINPDTWYKKSMQLIKLVDGDLSNKNILSQISSENTDSNFSNY